MSGTGWFEVEIEEVRAAGSAVLRTGDAAQDVAAFGVLLGRAAYEHAGLEGASARFADRFRQLTTTLGAETTRAGENLRACADSYEEVEILAPARFRQLGSDFPVDGGHRM